MFKSIFSKHFTVMSLVIVVSFVAMGGMQMLFSTRYWVSEKRALLTENARNVAEFTVSNAVQNPADPTSYILSGGTEPILRMLSTAVDGTAVVVDNDYKVVASSVRSLVGQTLHESVRDKITGAKGEYFSVDNFGGLYTSRQYTVGVPMESGDVRLGYVFMSTSAQSMNAYVTDNLQVFFLSALGVLTLTFIVLYALTYRMVRPLRQMAAATRAFGEGDFSVRVPVEGKDEVAELAAALNSMAVSLSSVEGMRRSFVANVSHELKTPMTTIAGFIDGILDGTIPPEKRDDYLKIVSEEIKRLSRLVRSMLNIARIEAGELELRPDLFDVNDTVIRTVFTFEQPLEAKNIEVRGLDGGKVMVEADPDLIHQVVYNLIENAVKFCNEGGFIDVNYSEDDSYTSVGIRNTGDGIPKDEIPHIFDRFYKADKSRSRDKGGAGLGLHIVRSIVNLHGGDIIVRSVEGEYCEFVFTIPKPHKSKKN